MFLKVSEGIVCWNWSSFSKTVASNLVTDRLPKLQQPHSFTFHKTQHVKDVFGKVEEIVVEIKSSFYKIRCCSLVCKNRLKIDQKNHQISTNTISSLFQKCTDVKGVLERFWNIPEKTRKNHEKTRFFNTTFFKNTFYVLSFVKKQVKKGWFCVKTSQNTPTPRRNLKPAYDRGKWGLNFSPKMAKNGHFWHFWPKWTKMAKNPLSPPRRVQKMDPFFRQNWLRVAFLPLFWVQKSDFLKSHKKCRCSLVAKNGLFWRKIQDLKIGHFLRKKCVFLCGIRWWFFTSR